MKVAKPNQVTNWEFKMMNPVGEEVSLGPFSTVYTLVDQVMSYIGIYDSMTKDEYSVRLKEEAAKVTGGDLKKYVKMLVEHQMCVRYTGRIACWSGGVGDDVHTVISKVEGFVLNNAPAVIVKAVNRFAKMATGGKSRTVSGCSSCGGSNVMDPKINNLGRAGTLNRAFQK